MTLNRDIFGPKKGVLNHIRWALVCAREDSRFWAEIRLTKLLRWLSPDDGRPCQTDVFLQALFDEIGDNHDRAEAIKAWLEGDWAEACEGLSIELKEPKP